jgi:hypothetical protein
MNKTRMDSKVKDDYARLNRLDDIVSGAMRKPSLEQKENHYRQNIDNNNKACNVPVLRPFETLDFEALTKCFDAEEVTDGKLVLYITECQLLQLLRQRAIVVPKLNDRKENNNNQRENQNQTPTKTPFSLIDDNVNEKLDGRQSPVKEVELVVTSRSASVKEETIKSRRESCVDENGIRHSRRESVTKSEQMIDDMFDSWDKLVSGNVTPTKGGTANGSSKNFNDLHDASNNSKQNSIHRPTPAGATGTGGNGNGGGKPQYCKPTSTSLAKKRMCYSFIDNYKPQTRVYEVVDSTDDIDLDTVPHVKDLFSLSDDNNYNFKSFEPQIADSIRKPSVTKINEYLSVINQGLKTTDLVQIHPLLNSETTIKTSNSQNSQNSQSFTESKRLLNDPVIIDSYGYEKYTDGNIKLN